MGISVATLALAKKFTKETAQQMGAVKGAPCTVESIEKEGKINTVTLQWENDQGATETTTVQIADGADGHDGQDGAPGRDGKDGKDGISTSENTIATVGFTADCDFVCDGTADNIEIQAAIDKIAAKGGGIVYVRDGNYTFNCAVEPKSNVEINMSTNTIITMDDQQIWTLPETTTVGTNIIKVSDEILDYVIVGQNIGLTDGTPGYIWEDQTTRQGNFITAIDKINKTVTLEKSVSSTFTTMVTMDCAFQYVKNEIIHNIVIKGGVIDGNKENQTVWLYDGAQNAILIGNCDSINVENVEVKNFFFQGIHLMIHSETSTNREGITATIKNCVAHDFNFSGICIDSTAYLSIENCIVYNCLFGIQGVHIEKINVVNCTTKNCSGSGIHFDGNPYRVPGTELDNNLSINNCTVINNDSGIIIQAAKNSIISGCIIQDNTKAGIDFRDVTKNFSIIGNTIINNGIGIKETNDCLDNSASSNSLSNNTTDYNIYTMKIGDSNSDVDFTQQSSTILKVQESNGSLVGGVIVDEGLITPEFTFVDLTDLPEVGVEHNGYLTAKPIENLKPNTPYTIWTDAPQYYSDYGTLYYGSITIRSTEEYGGVATWTSDENGVIWIWVIQGRHNEQGYIDGTYKVTIKEGTQPQPYVEVEPIMYTDKPASTNKIMVVNTIKSLVADSTDFDDFKSKIAAL